MKPLSQQDKLWAFRKATGGFARSQERWAERARAGLTDAQLEQALKYELGIFGGSGGPNEMDIMYQGAGLKIWAAWDVFNHVKTKPIFQGAATISMAREVYGIADPSNDQLALF